MLLKIPNSWIERISEEIDVEVIVRIFEQRKYQIRSWMRTVVFQGKNKLSQSDVAIKVFMGKIIDSI